MGEKIICQVMKMEKKTLAIILVIVVIGGSILLHIPRFIVGAPVFGAFIPIDSTTRHLVCIPVAAIAIIVIMYFGKIWPFKEA